MVGLAVIFGGAAIFLADIWIKNAAERRAQESAMNSPSQPKQEFTTIVVAKEPLRYGTRMADAELVELPWAKDKLPQGSFRTRDELLAAGDRVVLSPLEANEPILLTKLSGPDGRATLSNTLAPGMRAVTISTDEVAAVAGFITPGDRVDVVLTRSAGDESDTDSGGITSGVILSDIKVLSVEQEADERAFGAKSARSVTLEVDGTAVKKIALARAVGSLTLSLRAAGEDEQESYTAVGLADLFGGGNLIDKIKTVSVGNDQPDTSAPPEKQKYTTVIVTRGLTPEAYQVIEQQ
ncbi:MAG: Flp pilus assembly protein CpaB [Brucellaceae bacterium]|nr:Flp pilus assembly protein CpaB [Brucellaceae bacterium]